MLARYLFILAATCLAASSVAAEEAAPDWKTSTLTGDWEGKRADLYNKGIDFGLTHKSDFLSNTSGGIKRGTAWMGHTEARLTLDMEKLAGLNATTAYFHFHSALGSKFNRDYAGTFVGASNIETAVNTAQFYDAWVQKNFSDDSFSLLAGLYPVDSEFYVTDTSGLFIQPPYGMANDMAQGGQAGPPIFPMGALAVRMKYTTPDKGLYAMYALTDGVPGDPNNAYGTHIQLNKRDGSLSVMELGLTPQGEPDSVNKTAIGFWHFSSKFDDPIDVDALGNPIRRASEGVYFLAERTLMAEKDQPGQGLAGFFRYGTASKDLHQADWTSSIGLHYRGLFDGRDDDEAGIALTYNHAASKFQQQNPGAAGNQTQVELSYRAQINPWFALQPTLQYYANPNMKLDPNGTANLQNIWIVGARAEVEF